MKVVAYCTIIKTIELEVDDKFIELEETLKAINEKLPYEITEEEDNLITNLENDLVDEVITQVEEHFDCTVLSTDIWTSNEKMQLADSGAC